MSLTSFPTSSVTNEHLDIQLYTMIELEMTRYRAFFTKLTENHGPLISRHTALEFFRKSSLSEDQVQELYTQIKAQRLLRDSNHMNETEFILGMHLIVCMTKRHLVKIPSHFPTYLFPMLDLTAESVPKQVSQTCHDSKDQPKAQMLARIDQSEARALQHLHVYVERLADQVDKLGFPVPDSTRSLDALENLKKLLQKHVLAAKQEIQSMEIDAQMRSVASEVTQHGDVHEDPLKIVICLTQELLELQYQTTQLMAKKVDIVDRLVAVTTGGSAADTSIQQSSGSAFEESKNPAFALSKGALTVGDLGTFLATTTPPKLSDPALVQSHHSASSGGWDTFGTAKPLYSPPPQPLEANDKHQPMDNPPASSDPFGFGSLAAASGAAETTGTQKSALTSAPEDDFAWGSFE